MQETLGSGVIGVIRLVVELGWNRVLSWYEVEHL